MPVEILPPTAFGVEVAAGCLRSGGIVGLPTETVYGLAALFTDQAAVAKVFAAKDRPLFDPLIVHLADGAELARVAALGALDAAAREQVGRLADAFWPGPLTLVLPRQAWVADLVTSGLDSVAVRVPAHPLARALIAAVGTPLVAPSANRFGRISPTSAADVVRELGDRVPYVLDGGTCAVGVESTVVGVGRDGRWTLLRPGGVPAERIEAIVGELGGPGAGIRAPGQLASHYAPRMPLRVAPAPLLEVDRGWFEGSGPAGILVARGPTQLVVERLERLGHRVVAAESLSGAGDSEEAARHLFAALRRLDASGAAVLWSDPWSDPTGLGPAIQDRLTRASAKE